MYWSIQIRSACAANHSATVIAIWMRAERETRTSRPENRIAP